MTNHLLAARVAFAGTVTLIAEMWGKCGWMLALWSIVMATDYLTGSLAAFRNGQWDSTVARDGLWHKGAMIAVVLVAALFDLALASITASAGISMPFHVLVLPLVLAWYIVTELGSIVENAVKMGGAANVPHWLKKGLKIVSETIENAGESAVGGRDGEDGDNVSQEAQDLYAETSDGSRGGENNENKR